MNDVQRNFRRQQKQIERDFKHRWRAERYTDEYTGKKYIRYYDMNGTLIKTVERKSIISRVLDGMAKAFGIVILLCIILFIFLKFHVIIF